MANITNVGILNALSALGYPPDILGGMDTTGAQSSTFKNRLKTAGISEDDFNKAKGLAGIDTSSFGGMVQFLHGVGLNDDSINSALQASGSPPMSAANFRGENVNLTQLAVNVGQSFGGTLGQYLVTDPGQRSRVAGLPSPQPPGAAPAAPNAPAPGAAPAPAQVQTGPAQPPIGASPGGRGGPAGGGYQAPPPKSPADVQAWLESQFGYVGSLMQVPELNAIITEAAQKNLSNGDIIAKFESSNWFKTQSDAAKAWSILPAGEQNARIVKQMDDIKQAALGFGLTLSDDRLKQIAIDALSQGWDATQVNRAIGSEYHYVKGQTANVGLTNQMTGIQNKYLIPLSDSAITDWGQKIIDGDATVDQFTDNAKNVAKGLYSYFAPQIDQGMDVATLVDPYKQTLAKELEMSPDQIDFTDPRWQAALHKTDQKSGGQVANSLSDAQVWARQQPEWQQTNNAKSIVGQMAQKLGQMFGATT